MVQRDTALAQASTLREWADTWDRDAKVGQTECYGEVSFLLRRTATQIVRAATGESLPDPHPEIVAEMSELRPG